MQLGGTGCVLLNGFPFTRTQRRPFTTWQGTGVLFSRTSARGKAKKKKGEKKKKKKKKDKKKEKDKAWMGCCPCRIDAGCVV